jgi:hypothetical protein
MPYEVDRLKMRPLYHNLGIFSKIDLLLSVTRICVVGSLFSCSCSVLQVSLLSHCKLLWWRAVAVQKTCSVLQVFILLFVFYEGRPGPAGRLYFPDSHESQ